MIRSITYTSSDGPLVPRSPKSEQAVEGEHAQSYGQRLPTSNGPGNGAPGKNYRSKERELNAVGSAVADADATESVLRLSDGGWLFLGARGARGRRR